MELKEGPVVRPTRRYIGFRVNVGMVFTVDLCTLGGLSGLSIGRAISIGDLEFKCSLSLRS